MRSWIASQRAPRPAAAMRILVRESSENSSDFAVSSLWGTAGLFEHILSFDIDKGNGHMTGCAILSNAQSDALHLSQLQSPQRVHCKGVVRQT